MSSLPDATMNPSDASPTEPTPPKQRESLNTLPSEVLHLIFSDLGLFTLSSLLLVNHRLKDEALPEYWNKWALMRMDSLRIPRYLDYLESGLGILRPTKPMRTLRLTGPFDGNSMRNLARLFKNHTTKLRLLDLGETKGLDTVKWGPTQDLAVERMVAASGSGDLRTLVLPKTWIWRYTEMVYLNIPEYERLVKTPERKLALYDWVSERLGKVLKERNQLDHFNRLTELGITLDIWSIDDLSRMLQAWEAVGVKAEKLKTLRITTRDLVPDFFLSGDVGFYDPLPAVETLADVFPNMAIEPFAVPGQQQQQQQLQQMPVVPKIVRHYPFLSTLASLTIDLNASRDGLKDAAIASSFLLETLITESKSLKHLAILGVEWFDTKDLVLPLSLRHLDLRGCGMTVSQWKSLFTHPQGEVYDKLKSLVIDCTVLHVPYPRALEDDLDDPQPSPRPFLDVLARLEDLELWLPPIKFAGIAEDPVHRFPRKMVTHLEYHSAKTRVHLHMVPSLPYYSPQLLQAHVQLLSPIFPTPSSSDLVYSSWIHVAAPIRVPHIDLLLDCYDRFPLCKQFAAVPEGGAETWSGDSVLKGLVRDRGCGDARVEGGGLRGGGGLVFERGELERLVRGNG